MNRILYISSEAYPLIKTGGLGDVAGSLPRALQKNKQDVRLLLPAYREVMGKLDSTKVIATHSHYGLDIHLLETRLPGTRVKVWLVDCPQAFDRDGNPYVNAKGHSWHDNAFRFAVFTQVAVDIAMNRVALDWTPDIVHCNDWQTALVPALLSTYEKHPASVFTIHNMAYQGVFPAQTFFDLELPNELWGMHGLEFYDEFSFIKGGIAYADRVNTVSPTYAEEIQQAEFGYGLDGLLRFRHDRLSGITNGIDTDCWNPGTDDLIAEKYNRRNVSKKTLNKTYLQKKLGLPVNEKIPMLGMVSRLVEQKGLDIILGSIPKLIKQPLQIVILGSGEKYFENTLKDWSERHPDKFKAVIGYDEQLSHQIEAAADMYLMPSTFEPCGLNQMYSLRYGTLPIVRNVGGLVDTVCDANDETINNNTANGFMLYENTAEALITAIERAMYTYHDEKLWRQLQLNAMSRDSSWQQSANEYLALYQLALADNESPLKTLNSA